MRDFCGYQLRKQLITFLFGLFLAHYPKHFGAAVRAKSGHGSAFSAFARHGNFLAVLHFALFATLYTVSFIHGFILA